MYVCLSPLKNQFKKRYYLCDYLLDICLSCICTLFSPTVLIIIYSIYLFVRLFVLMSAGPTCVGAPRGHGFVCPAAARHLAHCQRLITTLYSLSQCSGSFDQEFMLGNSGGLAEEGRNLMVGIQRDQFLPSH